MRPSKPGKIVIISSPSGGGKTSICRKLLTPPRTKVGWSFSISYTTRSRRRGESDGKQYHFVSDEQFDKLARQDFFAEHFKVHLYKYGTPRRPIENTVRRGGVIILDVDVQGAQRLQKEYPDAVTIFIMPPSLTKLKQRLKKRGTETVEQFRVRFENARKEMKLYKRFDYVVVNNELSIAVNQVLSIITAHFCRTDRGSSEQTDKIVS